MKSEHGTKRSVGPSLAVIGGGLAGIAAAEAASRKGVQVDLFEWSRVLGGRAGSLFEPSAGQWIDNGQHLALGCCKELLALHTRLGLTDLFSRHETIPFAQTEGKHWTMAASPLLPKHWQIVPAFLKMPFLSFRDRLTTGLLMRKLEKLEKLGKQAQSGPEKRSFADWLAAEHASLQAVQTFWNPLIYSTLSETAEHVSLRAVQKVVRDGFLSGKEAMALHLPKVPLRTIYHEQTSKKLQELGVRLHFLSRVHRLRWEFLESIRSGLKEEVKEETCQIPKIVALELADGVQRSFDHYIMAVPVFRAWNILQESELEEYTDQLGLDRFEPGAITTVHLWFNRRLLPPDLPHTALLGGPGQFLFCPRSTNQNETMPTSDDRHLQQADKKVEGAYHTVVISASHRLLSESELMSKDRASLVNNILCQLRSTFPHVFQEKNGQGSEEEVKMLHSRVTTCFDAVFSPSPMVYLKRPCQETPFSNFALAGDWTQTGWPSTMEGAVLSGRAAVEALFGR